MWLVLLNSKGVHVVSFTRRHILQFCTKKLTFDRLHNFPLKQAVSARTAIFTTKITRKRDFKTSLQKLCKVAPF